MNERPTVQGLPADPQDERPGLTAALHSHDDTDWVLPQGWGESWEVILDTARPDEIPGARWLKGAAQLKVTARSLLILRRGT